MTPPDSTRAPRWHPRGFNNAAIVGATYQGASRLPTWMTYRMGHVATWLAYHLQTKGTRALLENLQGIFPDRDEVELRRLALLTYRSYARDVIDFMRCLSMTPDESRQMVGTLETGVLDEVLAKGRGAIVLSGHYGNWELGGVLLRRLTPYALSVVAKAEPSATVSQYRRDMRLKLGIKTIDVRQHLETAMLIRARLRENEIVAMLVDRYLGKDHVSVSFFGRPAKFLRTPALLASASGAPLLPCFVYRESESRFAVECGPAIFVSAEGDREANVQRATQQVASLMEEHIRRRPQYWYQFYPFWSSQED